MNIPNGIQRGPDQAAGMSKNAVFALLVIAAVIGGYVVGRDVAQCKNRVYGCERGAVTEAQRSNE